MYINLSDSVASYSSYMTKALTDFLMTKALTDFLWGFNGGFSCKSFSKLHPDWTALQRAIFEDMDATWLYFFFGSHIALRVSCEFLTGKGKQICRMSYLID